MKLSQKKIRSVVEKASAALLDYCMKWGIHFTVTGVSGGLDSAVTIALSQHAAELGQKKNYNLKSIGLILPCHSDPEHIRLAKKVIKKFKAEEINIDLTKIFDQIENEILKPIAKLLTKYQDNTNNFRHRTAKGNIKARLRMALGTYYIANITNGIVLSTDNLSEYFMGFWTLNGDVGDFGLIQNLWKSDELPLIAKFLKVPEEVIDAIPTDGLEIHPGGDEAQMGAPYPIVDHILRTLIKNGIDLNGPLDQLKHLPNIKNIHHSIVQKIAERSLKNSFKRIHPRNVSRKELGLNA